MTWLSGIGCVPEGNEESGRRGSGNASLTFGAALSRGPQYLQLQTLVTPCGVVHPAVHSVPECAASSELGIGRPEIGVPSGRLLRPATTVSTLALRNGSHRISQAHSSVRR